MQSIRALIAGVREAVREHLMFLGMSAAYESRTRLGYRVRYAWYLACLPFDLLGQLAASNHCAMRGHDIEDHSYGGPESGCVDLQCTRCGWGHHVTLY